MEQKAKVTIEAGVNDYWIIALAVVILLISLLFFADSAGQYNRSVALVMDNCRVSAPERQVFDTNHRIPTTLPEGVSYEGDTD